MLCPLYKESVCVVVVSLFLCSTPRQKTKREGGSNLVRLGLTQATWNRWMGEMWERWSSQEEKQRSKYFMDLSNTHFPCYYLWHTSLSLLSFLFVDSTTTTTTWQLPLLSAHYPSAHSLPISWLHFRHSSVGDWNKERVQRYACTHASHTASPKERSVL